MSARILVASCLTFVAGLRANATPKGEKTAYYQQKDRKAQIEIEKLEVFKIDSLVIIKGKISSSNDKLPLVGIKVSLKDGNQSVSSNEKGNFLIEIPAIPNQKIVLIFSYLGFETKEVEITDAQLNPVSVIASPVQMRTMILGGAVGGVVITTQAPWYKRVWNYVKQLF